MNPVMRSLFLHVYVFLLLFFVFKSIFDFVCFVFSFDFCYIFIYEFSFFDELHSNWFIKHLDNWNQNERKEKGKKKKKFLQIQFLDWMENKQWSNLDFSRNQHNWCVCLCERARPSNDSRFRKSSELLKNKYVFFLAFCVCVCAQVNHHIITIF